MVGLARPPPHDPPPTGTGILFPLDKNQINGVYYYEDMKKEKTNKWYLEFLNKKQMNGVYRNENENIF